MPDSLAEIPIHLQYQLRDADPVLAEVLSGQPLAPDLEASLADGSFPSVMPAGPTPEEIRHQQIQAICADGTNPFHPATRNLTRQQQLIAIGAGDEAYAAALPFIEQEAVNMALAREQAAEAARQNAIDHANAEARSIAMQRMAQGVF